MNSIYRSIWNDKTGTFVAVAENTMGAGRSASCRETKPDRGARFFLKAMTVSLLAAFGGNSYALPVGGVVTQGGASISGGAGSTTITQSSQNVAINWQGFSIGAGEAVRFVQPNSSSVALNRVLGPDPSSILGSMSANGKVFLLNPNGILFGSGSQVNVGGLVASTLNMTDSDFMAGNYRFSGSSNAAVVNQGTINAPGGYVALLGANVGNDGTILARLGTVALAAGSAMTLDVAGDGLLNVTVSQGAVNALAQNGGLIQADGGRVLLTAMAAGTLLQSAVNNTGVIRAQTIENHNGTIRLMGDMQVGTVSVGGTLDASAPNGGNGGFIEASAAFVKIAHGANITTAAPAGVYGTFLIDPQDFTVGSALGDNITGADLGALLVTNSVIISTDVGIDAVAAGVPPVSSRFSPLLGNGDIFITEAVTWVTGGIPTTLTLNAARDVWIGRDKNGLFTPTSEISATGGNLVVCCGRDVNVFAAITTAGAGGSILLSAGNNINQNAAITLTNGNMTMCAGNDVNVNAKISMTTIAPAPALSLGLADGLVLSAGNNGVGQGIGTVKFGALTPPATMVIVPVTIYYNPVSYALADRIDYSTGGFFDNPGDPHRQFMLVFPDGGDRTFVAGSTLTTFTGLKGLPPGVSLNPGGTANFDTPAVGNDKVVTFSGYTLAGADAGLFALPGTAICCAGATQRTIANIIDAPPIVPPVPPVAPPAAEEMMGPESIIPLGTVLGSLPRVELAGLPPQLLSIAPVPVPVVVPPPPPPVIQEAPIYVPPVRPAKQDRN